LVADDTGFVLTEKVALVAPAGTVTLDGTVATAALLLESSTTAPPAGAGLASRTVPVAEPPPFTQAGENESEAGGELDGWMEILLCSVVCAPRLSVTLSAKVKVPAVVGTPSNDAGGEGQSRLRPGGSCPEAMDQVCGPTPPERNRFWSYGVSIDPAAQQGFGSVIASGAGGSIVRVKACRAVSPAPSLTCRVKELVSTVVGVP
jgi:hypothetical protein